LLLITLLLNITAVCTVLWVYSVWQGRHCRPGECQETAAGSRCSSTRRPRCIQRNSAALEGQTAACFGFESGSNSLRISNMR